MADVGNVAATRDQVEVDPEAAPSPSGDQAPTIDELCAAAEASARALAHELGAWEEAGGAGHSARRAACSVCGEVAYVRIEDGLQGAAGGAISKQCKPP